METFIELNSVSVQPPALGLNIQRCVKDMHLIHECLLLLLILVLPPYLLFQNPKDMYAVGSKVEYSCVDGYYLQGQKIVECTDSLTWRRGQMECKSKT